MPCVFLLFKCFWVKFHAVSCVFNILEWNAMRFLVFQYFGVKCHAVSCVFIFFVLFESCHLKLIFLSIVLKCSHRIISFFVTSYVFLILNLVKMLRTFWNISPKINLLEWNAKRFVVFSKNSSEMPCGFSCFQYIWSEIINGFSCL